MDTPEKLALLYGPYRGVIELVHDGDSVHVALDVGFDLTVHAYVRVYGINAPELSTGKGKLARDYAKLLLPVGEKVIVISHGWDKYGGRIDGEIKVGVNDFAQLMIAAEYAVPYFP